MFRIYKNTDTVNGKMINHFVKIFFYKIKSSDRKIKNQYLL